MQLPPNQLVQAGALGAALLASLSCGTSESPETRELIARGAPDVVLVLLDTVRPDRLGIYGGQPEVAPFLSEVARDGVVFSRAFSTSGWTPPSTASALTGLYPTRHGVQHGLETNKKGLKRMREGKQVLVPLVSFPDDRAMLAERFQAAGYATFGVASNLNIGPELGFDRGFDRFERNREADAQELFDVIAGWESELERPGPTFLYPHLNDAHLPYHKRDFVYELPEDDHAKVLGRYDAEIHFMDARLRELGERLGWDENTVFCVISDHGEAFGEHGMMGHGPSLHTEVNQAVMMLRAPGVEAGRVDGNVSLVDVYPTLLDLAGIEPEPDLDGLSLLPLLMLQDRAAAAETLDARPLFANRRTRHPSLKQFIWSVVRGPWKLIVNETAGTTALFDTSRDPLELENLADANPALVAELRELRRAFLADHAQPERAATEFSLDAATIEHLKSVGYAGD